MLSKHLLINHRQHGFTLFEIVVVVLIIGVLLTMAIDRMLRLQIAAERISVQQTIGALQGAINLQVAELVVANGLDSMRVLENSNPINYLSELPHNYLGLKTDAKANDYLAGHWYFDDKKNTLVYLVSNVDFFETTAEGRPRIRLKVSLVYKSVDNRQNASYIQGVSLSSLDDYRWK